MNIKLVIKISLTFIFITVILYSVGIERILNNFASIKLEYFSFALLLLPLVIMVGTIKWLNIISHEAIGTKFNEALISFLGGATLGLITPGRLGELARVVYLKNGNLSRLAGIALVDKVIDLEVTMALGIVSAYIFIGLWPAVLLTALVIVCGIFIFHPTLFTSLLKVPLIRFKLFETFERFEIGMASIPKRNIFICMGYRLIASIIDILQFYLLINSFVLIDIVDVIAVYPIVILTNILPLTIGGIGIREGVSILTLAKFGIPPEAAASASFLLFCINTLVPGLLGTIFVSQARFSRVKI